MAYSENKNPNHRFPDRQFEDFLVDFPKRKFFDIFSNGGGSLDIAVVAKRLVLSIIAIMMVAMAGFTIFCLIATPERLVKDEITAIASDYYENYYYSSILSNNSLDQTGDFDKSVMENIMKNYTQLGFASVDLRQLLLYDNRKYASSTKRLEEYCDLDRTEIKIYPEAPFERQDYRIDYTYSCKF